MSSPYLTNIIVRFSQGKAARLARQTRELFKNSYLQAEYQESLTGIAQKYTDKAEQIQAELLLQSTLMQGQEANIYFIANRGLLLQKENYIEKGILEETRGHITGIAHIHIERADPETSVALSPQKHSFWNLKELFSVKQPSEQEMEQRAFQTYSLSPYPISL